MKRKVSSPSGAKCDW